MERANLRKFCLKALLLSDWRDSAWQASLSTTEPSLEHLEVLDWTLRTEETRPVTCSFVLSLLKKCSKLKRLSNLLFVDCDQADLASIREASERAGLTYYRAVSAGNASAKWHLPELKIWLTH